jgi:hypothetical protein
MTVMAHINADVTRVDDMNGLTRHNTGPRPARPVQDVHTALHAHPERSFNVVSFNVCGISSITRRHEIATFLHNEQPSVLVLQEPKLAVTPRVMQPPSFFPYNCVYFPHTRADTGVVFYIHPSIMYKRHDDTPHCADYNPSRKTTTVAFVTLFSAALTQPLILAGAYIDNTSQVAHIKAIARHVNTRTRVAAQTERPMEAVLRQLDEIKSELHELKRHTTAAAVIPPPPTDTHEVLPSHIPCAGLGLFVKRQVKGGHKVCDYPGEVIDRAEMRRRYPTEKGTYVAYIDNNTYIDAVNTASFGRYANCRNNHNKCTLRVNTRTKTAAIYVKAGCTLEPGEEVYMSYRSNYTLPQEQTQTQTQQPSAPHVLLVGDMNASFPAWDPHREATALGKVIHRHLVLNNDNMMAHKLTCLNSVYTRGKYTHSSNQGDRVIDLAMTTRPDLVRGMEVLYTHRLSSDHYPVRVVMQEDDTRRQERLQALRESTHIPGPDPVTGITPVITHLAWRVDTLDVNKLTAGLQPPLHRWMDRHRDKQTQTATLTLEEMTDCWVELHDTILAVATTCVGKKKITNQSKHWWNRQGRRTVQALHTAYKDAKGQWELLRRRKASATRVATARKARDEAQARFRTVAQEERQAAEEEFAASLDEHHKVAWSQFRRAVPRVFTPLAPFPHPTTGQLPERPQQALNHLATHLAGVSTIPQDPHFDTSMDAAISMEVQDMLDTPPTTREGLPFTLEQLQRYIPHIRLNTALGTDDVSPYFIKHGGDAMAAALYMLFSISYSHGHIPGELKHGKVAAIYKQTGRKDDASNYRPIAVTSVVMRLWEKMMKDTTTELMTRNGIPAMSQFGFTAKRSTYDAVYRLLSTTVDNFRHIRGTSTRDKHSPTVFIDVSKAYDTVWIQGLLYKLKRLQGMTPHLMRFYTNFLLDRTMAVHHSGLRSDTHTLAAGVPQGCVLGPFFYTIYVHDMRQGLHKHTQLSLFADDMALQPLGHAGTLALTYMRASLDAMTRYARRWKIKFSTTKTNVVFFRPPRHTLEGLRVDDPPHTQHKLKLGGAHIEAAKEYKYLGVLLDQHLTYLPHLQQLVSKTTTASHMICRLIKRDKLPSFPVVRQIVSAVLIPKLTYGFPFIRLPRIEDNVNNTATAVQTQTHTHTHTQTHTQTHTRARANTQVKRTNNIARQLKNVVIRPLRLSLGLPHSAHHNSVLMESRLMPLPYIQAQLTAACVTRWKAMEAGSNAGADKFTHDMHTAHAPHKYTGWHPLRHMEEVCARVPALASATQPATGTATLPRPVDAAWAAFSREWHADKERSLVEHYPSHIVNRKQLPAYTQHDAPAVTAKRARLRFRRALFGFNNKRMRFADNQLHCDAPECAELQLEEDTAHVLLHCPRHARDRDKLMQRLATLDITAAARTHTETLSLPLLLNPPHHRVLTPVMERLSKITGRFLMAVHRNKAY